MPANTSPIFAGAVRTTEVFTGTAANTAYDGTGTLVTIFTSNATNGSFVRRLFIKPRGTNVLTVLRFFLDGFLMKEMAMVATTASQTAALVDYELPLNLFMGPSQVLSCTMGTAVASGFAIVCEAGDY